MKKSPKDTIEEFVRSSSDEDVNYINVKFRDNLQGDLAELFYFISKANQRGADIGEVFSSAQSVHELYSFCDVLKEAVSKDMGKRDFSDRKPKKRVRR